MSGRRRIIAPDERHERRETNYANIYSKELEQRRQKNFPKKFPPPKKNLVTDMKLLEKSLEKHPKDIKKSRFTIHYTAKGKKTKKNSKSKRKLKN